MKRITGSRGCRPPQAAAFTLIEMMVAISVLALLVTMVGALMKGATVSTNSSNARMDADGEARLALDRIGFDLRRILLRPDIDYQFTQQTGNDMLGFYSSVGGYTGTRGYSVVAYSIVNNALERGVNGLNSSQMVFAGTAPTLFGNNTLTNLLPDNSQDETLGPSIFRFEVEFILKGGTLDLSGNTVNAALVSTPSATDSIQNISSIVVTIAALDSRGRGIVTDLGAVAALLPDAASGSDTAVLWKSVLAQSDFPKLAHIPAAAAAAIRVYQRSYDLPQSTFTQ